MCVSLWFPVCLAIYLTVVLPFFMGIGMSFRPFEDWISNTNSKFSFDSSAALVVSIEFIKTVSSFCTIS